MATSGWRLFASGGLGAFLGSAASLTLNRNLEKQSDADVRFGLKAKDDHRFLQPAAAPAEVVADGLTLVPRKPKEPKWTGFSATSLHQGIRPWDYNWDCRHYDVLPENKENQQVEKREDGEEAPKKRPTAVKHLILVRHGQYNLEGKTDEERVLTNLGIEQADHTGKRLANLNLPLTYMVSSNMSRAKQTAALIGQSLPEDLTVLPDDPILREGAPYPPEPGNVKQEVPYHIDGSRIEAAFRKYFHRADRDQEKDSYELVVCHANVIRYFVCRALQLPPEAWLRISLKHASITWITIRPSGTVSVRALGEASHIPPEKLSTTQAISPF